MAAETGAEVARGPLRYPSDGGGWQVGERRRHKMQIEERLEGAASEGDSAV